MLHFAHTVGQLVLAVDVSPDPFATAHQATLYIIGILAIAGIGALVGAWHDAHTMLDRGGMSFGWQPKAALIVLMLIIAAPELHEYFDEGKSSSTMLMIQAHQAQAILDMTSFDDECKIAQADRENTEAQILALEETGSHDFAEQEKANLGEASPCPETTTSPQR